MNIAVLAIVCFVFLASATAAVGLAVRDLFFRRAAALEGAGDETRPRLGRLALARDFVAPTGFVGRIDGQIDKLIAESGIPVDGLTFTLTLVLGGLLCGGGALLWTDDVFSGVIGFAAGMVISVPYLSLRRSRRMRTIQTQLADMLDLMARAIRAGESLEQAIALVGERAADPLGVEFRRCARHLQMGLSINGAMRSLVHRLPLMDVRILATTLAVHRQAGGNLTLTLERMARVVRDRMVYRQQIRSVTAAGRFSATMIATVGPLLFLYMFTFQRAYVSKLLDLPLGNMMLVIAVILEVIGLVWISRMSRTEY